MPADAQPKGGGACRSAVGEKLGIAFFHVCPADPGERPFWISAPIPCGQGEHAALACPQVTALVRVDALEAPVLRPGPVVMVDSLTAHRLCGLRFAGTLPTRAQRRIARDRLGVATLLATQGPGVGDELGLAELPEWVTEGSCNNPSMPGSECRMLTFPPALLRLPLAWDAVRACDASPLAERGADHLSSELGASCRGAVPAWQRLGKDRTFVQDACLLRDPGAARSAYALQCKKPLVAKHSTNLTEAVAAVRCVVQSWALGSIDSAARPH